jgi:hypothetical protein
MHRSTGWSDAEKEPGIALQLAGATRRSVTVIKTRTNVIVALRVESLVPGEKPSSRSLSKQNSALLEKEWEEKTFESDGATERARASS